MREKLLHDLAMLGVKLTPYHTKAPLQSLMVSRDKLAADFAVGKGQFTKQTRRWMRGPYMVLDKEDAVGRQKLKACLVM